MQRAHPRGDGAGRRATRRSSRCTPRTRSSDSGRIQPREVGRERVPSAPQPATSPRCRPPPASARPPATVAKYWIDRPEAEPDRGRRREQPALANGPTPKRSPPKDGTGEHPEGDDARADRHGSPYLGRPGRDRHEDDRQRGTEPETDEAQDLPLGQPGTPTRSAPPRPSSPRTRRATSRARRWWSTAA